VIFTAAPLRGVFLVDPEKLTDDRGFFASTFGEREFAARGLPTHFVGMNSSYSALRGTLRGMHYQAPPRAQAKLVRCIRGALRDVILDLRPGSSSFGQSFSAELTAENRRALFIPKGFAHGLITLADDTEVLYLIDEVYSPTHERGVRWNDPRFGLQWPIEPAVMSERDRTYPDYAP
jgi:dTDP-4-dehydrorhamnose 3,5-epimerase